MQAEMPDLLSPDNVWIFVAVIAVATVIACLRLIGHAYYDAIRWHDLRVEVKRLQADQRRRLDKLARLEAGVGARSRSKRSLPETLREPVAMSDVVDAVEVVGAEPVEMAAAA